MCPAVFVPSVWRSRGEKRRSVARRRERSDHTAHSQNPLHAIRIAPIDMCLGMHHLCRRGALPGRGAVPSLVAKALWALVLSTHRASAASDRAVATAAAACCAVHAAVAVEG